MVVFFGISWLVKFDISAYPVFYLVITQPPPPPVVLIKIEEKNAGCLFLILMLIFC